MFSKIMRYRIYVLLIQTNIYSFVDFLFNKTTGSEKVTCSTITDCKVDDR